MATISGVWLLNETLAITEAYEGTTWYVNFRYLGSATDPDYWPIGRAMEPYYYINNSHHYYLCYPSFVNPTESRRYVYNVDYHTWGYTAGNKNNYFYANVDFGSESQTVSDDFYTWFTANATYVGPSGITGITLNNTNPRLYRGEEFQFEATIEGSGYISDRSVIYSIIDIDTTSTTVDQNTGLFTVGMDETKSAVRVLVQSVQNPEIYTEATVTILDPEGGGEGGGDGGEGGGEGGDVTTPDIKPVYRCIGDSWVKLTAYQRISGEWVLISTAGN